MCVFRFILKISNLQLTNQNAGFVTAMRCVCLSLCVFAHTCECLCVSVCVCTHMGPLQSLITCTVHVYTCTCIYMYIHVHLIVGEPSL